ncbi:hypothetical protein FRB99_004074 [Tulasnella sp. 403]|nr:hypothetical protein FRB99_004074 [Tulasnella sp. 403]
MDTSDTPGSTPKETSVGDTIPSIIPPDASIAQPTPLPGQPLPPPEGGDVFMGPQIPPPTFPPQEISTAEAVVSLVNVQAEQGKDSTTQNTPQVSFEETPKASQTYTGPIETPQPNPLTFFGRPTKKSKKSESNLDLDIEFLDDTQVLADAAKCTLD